MSLMALAARTSRRTPPFGLALQSYEAAANVGNGRAHLAAAALILAGSKATAQRPIIVDHFRQAARILGTDKVVQALYEMNSSDLFLTVQAMLNQLGHDSGTPDGVYGRQTQSAIDEFCGEKKITDCPKGIITTGLLTALLDATP